MKQNPVKFVKSVSDFPNIREAQDNPDGLLAISHLLSTDLVIAAYHRGIFPWFSELQPVLWWSPSKRAILHPAQIKLRKSLKQSIRKNQYQITINRDFTAVINCCAKIKRTNQDDTWINKQMIDTYKELNKMGYAHSIECWKNGMLVGGLYGIFSDGLFCGESMFSMSTDASKACLLALAQNSSKLNINIIDCQIINPFLKSMGAMEITRNNFLKYFKDSVKLIKIPDNDVLTIKL